MKITELTYNLVDMPWDFYSVRYILDNDLEHIVYIPCSTIREELVDHDIVEILCMKLRAELACVPEHVDRITKSARTRSDQYNKRSTKKRRLAKLRADNGVID